ncbi:unnamed protein product [Lepeophtheirus salmonis]|uniref:(salmon louse) hypothetical protein n=1 Tax=Lepeophtheirus salmonis TaxID=72036 RepID=A0A7R8DCD9_LEPSM|nr:unnamed protein product [Lepeophtheirus salmonis]CAF3041684.1 unnamed protein product [Lepeophtheirus salmonis]
MLFFIIYLFLVLGSQASQGTTTVSHPKGCFFNIKPDDLLKKDQPLRGSINNIRSEFKDCVLIFHATWGKQLHLTFDQFDALSEEVDSCVSSTTKIFTIDDSGERNKLAHYCNSLPTKKLIVFDTTDKVELIIFHSNIDLIYEYMGSHDETDESEDAIKNESYINPTEIIITFKDPPSKVCKLSRFCGEGDGILCNKTMYLCIDPAQLCNGVKDCIGDDSSDEFRCFFPYMSNSLFSGLRKNNMVRYNGDVLKRKDVIRAKKNNVVERETTNDILNKSGANTNNNGKSLTLNVSSLNNNNNLHKETPKVEIFKPEPEVKKRVVIESEATTASSSNLQPKRPEENALGMPISSIMKNSTNNSKKDAEVIPLYQDNDEEMNFDSMDGEELMTHSVGYGYRFEYRDT